MRSNNMFFAPLVNPPPPPPFALQDSEASLPAFPRRSHPPPGLNMAPHWNFPERPPLVYELLLAFYLCPSPRSSLRRASTFPTVPNVLPPFPWSFALCLGIFIIEKPALDRVSPGFQPSSIPLGSLFLLPISGLRTFTALHFLLCAATVGSSRERSSLPPRLKCELAIFSRESGDRVFSSFCEETVELWRGLLRL